MSTCRSSKGFVPAWRALLALAAVQTAGCGLLGGTCTVDAPASCPASPPNYAQVQPILGHACVLCHAPDGQLSTIPLDSYDAVFVRRVAAQDQVSKCAMPKDGVVLSDAERLTLLTWFVCGAPR